jgi:hypothetical protein
MYKPQAAWQMPINIPKQQELLMNSSAFVQTKLDPKTHGPVSNEFNVIVCIILLLGGIANLAMVKAYFLETEAQLLFALLCFVCSKLVEVILYLTFGIRQRRLTQQKSSMNVLPLFSSILLSSCCNFLSCSFVNIPWMT